MEAAKFLSTPSARRATRSGWRLLTRPSDFYPRPPRGGRPVRSRPLRSSGFDFYPRPPRGGRPVSFVSCYPAIGISIHALREESDEYDITITSGENVFLSTPSARRATDEIMAVIRRHIFLSTPSARRATNQKYRKEKNDAISIHALREESDPCSRGPCLMTLSFLSTPSARRATRYGGRGCPYPRYFYPRPPRGERHHYRGPEGQPSHDFYPRPPRGERQAGWLDTFLPTTISIHALREESDKPLRQQSPRSSAFLSTPSARRATPCFR